MATLSILDIGSVIFGSTDNLIVIGYEKRDLIAQNAIFTVFQTFTILRSQEPQASHVVCR